VANINSPTLIGSEFIDILPGTSRTYQIPAGGQISSVERKNLSEYVEDLHLDIMLARVEDTMTNVASLTSQLQEPAGPFLGTMADVRQMTSTVAGGQGSLGKVLYDIEAYGKLNHSLDDVNAITANFSDLSGRLNKGIPPIINQVEQGTRHLPEIGRGVREGLRSANQVLESVKRNFLIRGNLPSDPAPETPTVPARQGF
jgi:phospholipid/cholesterol/gamma-HCH transport system substrate-binding protein